MAKVNMNTRKWILGALIASFVPAIHADGPVLTSSDGKQKTLASSALDKLAYPELCERYQEYKAKGDKEMVLKYAERMVKMCDDPAELADLTLEVGDLYFDKGWLTEAEQYYSEYSLIFQGSEKAEYAHYKSILCAFKRTLDIDRDQTKTEEAIAMADKFLARPAFTTHAKEVETIRLECYKKLAEREIYVCDFYIKKGSVRACERRLDVLKTEWLPKLPELGPRVAVLESSITDLRALKGIAVPTITTPAVEVADLQRDEKIEVADAGSKKHMADRF